MKTYADFSLAQLKCSWLVRFRRGEGPEHARPLDVPKVTEWRRNRRAGDVFYLVNEGPGSSVFHRPVRYGID